MIPGPAVLGDSANSAGLRFPRSRTLPWGVFSERDGTAGSGREIGGTGSSNLICAEARGRAERGPGMPGPFAMACSPFMASARRPLVGDAGPPLADLLDADGGDRSVASWCADGCHDAFPIFARSVHRFLRLRANDATKSQPCFRGADNALPPNWLQYPHRLQRRASNGGGYRARRFSSDPGSQLKAGEAAPAAGAIEKLDYRAGLGAHRGTEAAQMGQPVSTGPGLGDDLRFRAAERSVARRRAGLGNTQPLGPFQSPRRSAHNAALDRPTRGAGALSREGSRTLSALLPHLHRRNAAT